MSHYLAHDVPFQRAKQPLDRGVAKLANGTAAYAEDVVVMLDSCQAVLGSAVRQGQLSDDSGVQQQLDRQVHRGPTDLRQLAA